MNKRYIKKSSFVLLERTDNNDILCVRNSKNKIGLPGGKGEINRLKNGSIKYESQFNCAIREFQEETNNTLPKLNYKHIEWGEKWHRIRIFYASINSDIAQTLDGNVNDPDEDIIKSEWLSLEQLKTESVLYHINKSISLWKIINKSI